MEEEFSRNHITLVLHSTIDYLYHLKEQLKTWQGGVSVAVLIPNPTVSDAESLLYIPHNGELFQMALEVLETPFFKDLRKINQTSLHIFFEKQNFKNCPLVAIPNFKLSEDFDLESIKKYGQVTDIYPINAARNIARKGIKTELFISGDIEQFYIQNFESRMLKLANQVLLKEKQRTVLIHRRFEIAEAVPIPKNKNELKILLSHNLSIPFHSKLFYPGHIIPNLDDWLRTVEDTGKSKITKVVPYNSNKWEPQFVGDSRIPFHDERWPYRYRNNAHLALHLCYMNFTFSVVSDVFSIHRGIQMQWQRPEYGKIGFCIILLFCGFIWTSYNNQIENILGLTLFKERKEIEGFYDEIVNATENWSQANVEQWHFGNYCVWFNFTKAIQTPDEKSVTLCTHGTAGYSRFIFDHANYWNDQISLALLLDPAGFSALSAYRKFHKCTAASKRISTHLVWSQKYGNCSTDFVINGLSAQPPDPTPEDCNLETHLALFKHNFQDPYPPNTLRNVARAGANTQGHLIADIENHFSQDAAEIIRTLTDTIQSNDTVIVIRRFESDEKEDIPRNVSSLKKLVDQGKAGEFHFKFFSIGHSVPFLQEFFNYSTTPGTLPRLTPLEYQGSRWEPQMVVHQSHPFHFEGIPIRYNDQQVLSYELCRLRVNFTVASHVFSVHQGIKTKKSEKETLAHEQAREEGNFYKEKFREYLLETYPDTNKECGEF